MRLILYTFLWLASFVLTSVAQPPPVAETTVVLANANSTESINLARHYMRMRQIPNENLCLLDVPESEVISQRLYDIRIHKPLLDFLRDQNLIKEYVSGTDDEGNPVIRLKSAKLTTMVSVYGVPARIADEGFDWVNKIKRHLRQPVRQDGAAVDSELAGILLPHNSLDGPQPNPLFRAPEVTYAEAGPHVVVCTRLDGPSPASVRHMIEEVIEAEYYGLTGRAYFDARGLKTGSYLSGDQWIESSYHTFMRQGFDCEIDRFPAVWSKAFPMEDAAVYMGWYTDRCVGPFMEEHFRFKPGAVAYHLHSYSARVLRSPDRYWTGPLVSRGASATMGCVNEPYLAFTPQLDVFSDRLCRGNSFGESAYMSMSALSWQVTVVGDPHYRPFRFSLDEQIAHMEEDKRPELEWGYLRKVNILYRSGQSQEAFEFCMEKAQQLNSLVLYEKLAQLHEGRHEFDEALATYKDVVERAATACTAVRSGRKALLMLRRLDRDKEAYDLEDIIRRQWKGHSVLGWLETAYP